MIGATSSGPHYQSARSPTASRRLGGPARFGRSRRQTSNSGKLADDGGRRESSVNNNTDHGGSPRLLRLLVGVARNGLLIEPPSRWP